MTPPATLLATASAHARAGRPGNSAPRAGSLADRFRAVRGWSEHLCETLVAEDYVVQSMPDVSPTKWHLAHTSWFFETFLLKPHAAGYREFDPHFAYLFNASYLTVGDRHCRQNRGLLSRPTCGRCTTTAGTSTNTWPAGLRASRRTVSAAAARATYCR